jgi:glycosyltransferase involved in cell wall biosynthesis
MNNVLEARSICIVTPGYIASTPRVVREADALSQAGYRVRVVFSQGAIERERRHDALLLQDKPWRWAAVGWSRRRPDERLIFWRSTLRYKFAQRLPRVFWHFWGLVECAERRIYPELALMAAAEPAELFIGHYPVGLAAAAYAAAAWGAKLGYDAEDLHTEEQPETRAGQLQTQRIDFIERKYYQRCAHLTAVSPGIADALVKRYGPPKPLVMHNVFPWADRAHLDGQIKDRQGPELSLYWFSQTIGFDRGIEDAIRASGLLRGPVQIHLRGSPSEPFKTALLTLARECGVAERLYFHPPVPPMELPSRAAEHDVGLALEQPINTSRMLSVTNKLFLYLLSGLAIAATDVPGQRSVMDTCPDAGCVYQPGDYRTLASYLERWRQYPHKLHACKEAALAAACDRWNWEHESQKLVHSISTLLSGGQKDVMDCEDNAPMP